MVERARAMPAAQPKREGFLFGNVVWWGLSDPAFIPGSGWLRRDGTPKEVYHRMRALLRGWGHAR